MRLQVFLSHSGICSRRQAMDIIKEGRVKVNGRKVVEPSTPVDSSSDKVYLDDKEVKQKSYLYILFNKQKGYVTTKLQQSFQKTIYDSLPQKFRHLSPVGRLDKNTEGLLLLTNDGDVAYKLTHPKFDIDKTYFVRISGKLENNHRLQLERGVIIDRKKTALAKITPVKWLKNQTALKITIHEGRKRQIRLMFSEMGYKVLYLKRLSQGPLQLGEVGPGCWRPLNQKEIGLIKNI